jgi:hypothetical protein
MESMHKQLSFYPGFNEYFFYVNSDEIVENIDYIKNNNIRNIGVNKLKGYKLNDLKKITEVSNQIEKLSIGGDIDLSDLSEFKNLEYLVANSEQAFIDFSKLSKLKYLAFFYYGKMTGFENLSNLETINVSKADPSFLTEDIFRYYKKLTRLEIVQSKLPEELDFLKYLTKLKELEFHYCKSKIDLSELLKIKGSLEILKIGHSKNVVSIEALTKLKKLTWLSLVDSIPLADSKFINDLPALEVLVVLGSSFFVDGNIDNLKGKLRHVGIDDKRHYTLKTKDFKAEKEG